MLFALSSDFNIKTWKTLGILGLIAAVMVGIGEFMVHYSYEGYDGAPLSFFTYISKSSLFVGHWLMVVFLPLYIFGYLHLYLGLRLGSEILARLTLILGVFAFMIGSIWVGSRAFIGNLHHLLFREDTMDIWKEVVILYDLYMENLLVALRVLVLLLSITFTLAIFRGGTPYPRWMAFISPIVLLLFIFLINYWIPSIGIYLIPAAMNVAHIIVFSFSLIIGSQTVKPS